VAGDTHKKASIVERVWGVLASVKMAVIVFALISVVSIIGTLLDQGGDAARNQDIVAKFVGTSAAPKVFAFLDAVGFTDMYHSWWFIALLYLFACNLTVCSLDRLPRIWRIVREPIKPLTTEQAQAMPVRRDVVFNGNKSEIRTYVLNAMKSIGLNASETEGPDKVKQFIAENGRYSRLGVYLTHVSILIILAGAMVGMKFGFNATLNLLEGTSSSVAYAGADHEIPLGFDIRCEDFSVTFYEGSDTPKSFKSRLSITEDGKPVLIDGREVTEIEVNRPLRYKGITFYQASYGFVPNRNAQFRFALTGKNGEKQGVSLKFGESFTIPGTEIKGKIADFSPALAVDESGNLFTYAEMMNNPAVFIEFSEKGNKKYGRWILMRQPETWNIPDGRIEFVDLWGAQYTGLQVRKDPGVEIVYLGCIFMTIGLYMSFFMSHTRVWVMMREERGKIRFLLVGSSSKNRLSLEGKIDRLASKLAAVEKG
jgi:cytochrome c biogenesis protein